MRSNKFRCPSVTAMDKIKRSVVLCFGLRLPPAAMLAIVAVAPADPLTAADAGLADDRPHYAADRGPGEVPPRSCRFRRRWPRRSAYGCSPHPPGIEKAARAASVAANVAPVMKGLRIAFSSASATNRRPRTNARQRPKYVQVLISKTFMIQGIKRPARPRGLGGGLNRGVTPGHKRRIAFMAACR